MNSENSSNKKYIKCLKRKPEKEKQVGKSKMVRKDTPCKIHI